MVRNYRKASHSGSWYSKEASSLSKELHSYLKNTTSQQKDVKAIICPHAGYYYCGATAAHSWINLEPSKISTIFIMGPSHFCNFSKCAIPNKYLEYYKTPFGDLQLNKTIIEKLRQSGYFLDLSLEEDEREHSIEMQLPYIKYITKQYDISIVPILVPSMSIEASKNYAHLLLPYFLSKNNVFVISSDFCHWGSRFNFVYTHPIERSLPIYKSIQLLDFEGVKLIETHDDKGFQNYLNATDNTICGRLPIRILLHMINYSEESLFSTNLLHYSQSSQVTSPHDSSVSYAALLTSYI